MNEQATIKIPLTSGGSVELLLEDARELRDKLNEIFGEVRVYPVPLPTYPVPIPLPTYPVPIPLPTYPVPIPLPTYPVPIPTYPSPTYPIPSWLNDPPWWLTQPTGSTPNICAVHCETMGFDLKK